MIEKFNSRKVQIGIYTSLDFLPRFVSFLTLPLFLRIILPKYWGQIALLLVIQKIYTVLIQHGIKSELLIIPYKLRDNVRYHSKRILEMISVFFLVLTAQHFLFQNFQFEFTLNSANWMLLSALFISISSHIRTTLNLQNKFGQFIGLSLTELILVPSFQVIFVLREIFQAGFSSTGTVSAYMIGYSVGVLIAFGFYVPIFFKKLSRDKIESFENNRNFKIALLIQSLFIFSISFQDRFLIQYYLDSTQVAIYSSMDSIARMAKLVPQGIITFLTINFFSDIPNKQFMKKNLSNIISISSYVLLLIILSKNVFLDFLLPKLYSSESLILTILSIASWFWALSNLVSIELIDNKENKTFIFSSGLGFFLNLILNILLIPNYGIYGSAAATLVSIAILLIIKVLSSQEFKTFFFSIKLLKITLPIIGVLILELLLSENLLIFVSVVLIAVYLRKGFNILKLLTTDE